MIIITIVSEERVPVKANQARVKLGGGVFSDTIKR